MSDGFVESQDADPETKIPRWVQKLAVKHRNFLEAQKEMANRKLEQPQEMSADKNVRTVPQRSADLLLQSNSQRYITETKEIPPLLVQRCIEAPEMPDEQIAAMDEQLLFDLEFILMMCCFPELRQLLLDNDNKAEYLSVVAEGRLRIYQKVSGSATVAPSPTHNLYQDFESSLIHNTYAYLSQLSSQLRKNGAGEKPTPEDVKKAIADLVKPPVQSAA